MAIARKVLSRVAELVIKAAVFLRKHGSVELVTLFDDNRFQFKVLYLEDIFSILNELGYSLEEKNKTLMEAAEKVSAFRKLSEKVSAFRKKRSFPMEKEGKKPEFCIAFTVGQ